MTEPPRRPTPIRESLLGRDTEPRDGGPPIDAPPEEARGRAGEPREPPPGAPGTSGKSEAAARRVVETREGRWEVRVAGATRSGTGPDAGASLLLLVFSSEDEPELPRREILTAGRSLEALTGEELEELLARSRPRPPT